MVGGRGVVQSSGHADLRIDQANVPLGAPVKSGLVAELVVNAHQPAVFVNGGLDRMSELFYVRGHIVWAQLQSAICGWPRAIGEGAIRENVLWRAASNRAG